MNAREALHLTPADARRVPWRNGRGVTEELACWPPGASLEHDDLDWRISKAAVETAGPFSHCPGLERILVVTEGQALALDHGDAAPRALLRRLEPYRFSGDWPTRGEPRGGTVRDCNVMVRRGSVRADVEAVRLGSRQLREELGCDQLFLHLVRGRCQARLTGEEQAFALAPCDSLWVRHARSGDELTLAGGGDDCELLLVRLTAIG